MILFAANVFGMYACIAINRAGKAGREKEPEGGRARMERVIYAGVAASIMTRPSSQGEPWSGHLFDRKRVGEVY